MLAATTLTVLHLAAFFQADDIIMREIPGSHPYLTGLGILGGMYSFANPLQGDVSTNTVTLLTLEINIVASSDSDLVDVCRSNSVTLGSAMWWFMSLVVQHSVQVPYLGPT